MLASKRSVCAQCWPVWHLAASVASATDATWPRTRWCKLVPRSVSSPRSPSVSLARSLTMRTFHTGGIAGAQGDITQGLPRVEELFEARVPKDKAEISEIDGVVEIVKDENTAARTVRVVSTNVFFDEYPLPEGQPGSGQRSRSCAERPDHRADAR